MTVHSSPVGVPVSRVDGPLKVTGQAKYAGEFTAVGLAYGVVLSSAITKGKIVRIDTRIAEAVPGVLRVYTHENRPKVAEDPKSYQDQVAPPGEPLRPLHNAEIHHAGQPIALVVAEEFEVARFAASLIDVVYEAEPAETDLGSQRDAAYVPSRKRDGYNPPAGPRGNAEKVFDKAKHRVAAEYSIMFEHHNPIEMFATTAVYERDGKLTVYDKIQGVLNSQKYITNVFGLKTDQVHVISPFVGGAFGSGLRPQHQLFMAVMAALDLKRPVKVTLTRQQMFSFGYRPNTLQRLALSTDADGGLTSFQHHALSNTSRFEDYEETVVNWAGLLYKCDNTHFTHKLAQLDLPTPQDMRAPGAVSGMFAIESAVDEMAYVAGVDPLEFRLKNYSEVDQNTNRNYTSKALRAAYQMGSERFGWAKRSFEPRSMRDGKDLIGWGMATGVWEAQQQKCSAMARLTPDGRLVVGSATADIGTGTYTIMTQLAAEALGLPVEDVTMKLGDSDLPESPIEGGSWTAASVGSAVTAACQAVKARLVKLARGLDYSPLANADVDHVVFADGRISLKSDPARFVTLKDALRANGYQAIEEQASAKPGMISNMRYSRYTHSAIFVEVRVDEDLRVPRVMRVVSAIAAGRIINPKTARSQILGGVVMGVGMALTEETMPDHRLGRFMNHNLAEYHVPVNADIRDIEVIFVPEDDPEINELGIKGLGEIGIVGTAAAVANAIFHATGKRVRDLPITIDKIMAA